MNQEIMEKTECGFFSSELCFCLLLSGYNEAIEKIHSKNQLKLFVFK